MLITLNESTTADPVQGDADAVFADDDSRCLISVSLSSPIASRLMLSGMRPYTISTEQGPGELWVGNVKMYRPSGNRFVITADKVADVKDADDASSDTQ